jgi:hypothetical protein
MNEQMHISVTGLCKNMNHFPNLDILILYSLHFCLIVLSLLVFLGTLSVHASIENDTKSDLSTNKWISLGGVLTSSPSAVVLGDGNISVLAHGNLGLWGINSNNSAWGNWTYLSATNSTSGLSALALSDSTLSVFSRGPDNGLWYTVINGTRPSSWKQLHGIIQSTPAGLSINDSSIMVMAEGADGSLWYRISNNRSWGAWKELGSHVSSSPSLVKNRDGGIHIFARGIDNNLWFTETKNASWSNWKTLKGGLSSAPSAIQLENGTIAVFGVGAERSLWYRTSHWDVWSDWNNLGGSIYGAPSAIQLENGTIAVFGVGADKSLWYRHVG